ncbi:MAG: asparaginase [Pontibacterium sp.]
MTSSPVSAPANSAPLLVIYTGGTLGMLPSDQGLAPSPDFEPRLRQALSDTQATQPDLHLPEFEYLALGQAIDSANLMPFHWQQMATYIIEHYQDYSGFVVLHGTDTMAYTASALAFMLRGLTKPIVLTGSQLPLIADGSDASANVINALTAAQSLSLSPQQGEVYIAFDQVLLRGCCASKVSSHQLAGFDSPSYPALGFFDTLGSLTLNHEHSATTPHQSLALSAPEFIDDAVAVLHLAPGAGAVSLAALSQQPELKAIIILSYGAGNMCSDSRAFCRALQQCQEAGIFVLNLSQCHDGEMNQSTYASGHKLNDFGVVSGGNMTVEAAYSKLHLLIAQGYRGQDLAAPMAENWVNELH